MNKNEFLILREIYENGYKNIREFSNILSLSIGTVSSSISSLKNQGLIEDKNISKKGIKELNNYRVKSAIILCAGASTRFAPFSFEKPKGLFEVKGEILVERQIKQLKEAGIANIFIVLGYKKESFFYLAEKYGLHVVINSEFMNKNNCESLYLVKEHFENSYICSCDQYFVKNPFHQYEFESIYTTVKVEKKLDEDYVEIAHNDEIKGKSKIRNKGLILLGFSFWNKEFGDAFKKLLEEHHDIGDFDHDYWETVFLKNIHVLPAMHSSLNSEKNIFEFDNLTQLRKFDETYVENTSSKIFENIASVLDCDKNDIHDFLPIKEGMTNTSYIFEVDGVKYVYRHPGEGTEKIIKRNNEKKSLILAKKLGIDPSYIFMDEKTGWKISKFIENTAIPSYLSKNDTKLVINKLRELHDSNIHVDYNFLPFEDALEMEKILKTSQGISMPDFEELKQKINNIYKMVKDDKFSDKCFCHCDTYRFNWLISNDTKEVTLIDWEYAGEADRGVDVGYYIVDAMYEFDEAKSVIKEYLGDEYSYEAEKHYMSYIAIVAYYWFVWALYRESCRAIMGESLYNWYFMAKKYSKYVLENYND
ncbi:MAG: phosphocholine cytidylyltransferase/choline kinase family protein [Bacilli bacterium]|nr:phosphocholine cytidylyltransferase/choline kinase family protein [Bacilli bacterium]